MLSIKYIRENIDAVKNNCKNRNISIDIDHLLLLDTLRREYVQKSEGISQQQNNIAKQMKSPMPQEERDALIEQGKALKADFALATEQLAETEMNLRELLNHIPNMTHSEVPIATNEADSSEISQWGDIPNFSFSPLDHVELAEKLDLIDFESAARVTGQKFYYLKNEAVLLEQALILYAMHMLRAEGFTPIMTPDMARASILDGIGFNPRGAETQIYSIANTDLCMIATAEITLGGLMADQILSEEQLPMKFVGLSHCFRTEAGAAGRESRGLYRVHQFTKIEMFAFTTPEESDTQHSAFLNLEERLFQGLGIPYRVLDICTADLGGPAYRKYDLEAWMPGRGENGKWGEVTSTSNCTDYQARRLKIRYRKNIDKKTQFVHMINGTAIAISRALIAILENYQQADGSVRIPEVLMPYLGGITHISPRK